MASAARLGPSSKTEGVPLATRRRLNITVMPKRGRLLMWTSVTDDDPFERDDRTDHEALAVEGGIKYAANYWLHMYPFRGKSDRCENIAYADNWY